MSLKFSITLGVLVGSTIGGYIPMLWGDDSFLSMSVVFFSFIGGIAGIFFGRWFYNNFFE